MFFRLEPDPSSVTFNQFSAEIEAEPCSGDARLLGIAGADKASKEPGLLLMWNAHPLIAHAEMRFVCPLVPPDGHFNRATFGAVFDRIAQHIGKHLLQTEGVSCSPEIRTGGLKRERMALGRGLESQYVLF